MHNSRGDGEDRFIELSTTLRRKLDDKDLNSIPMQELKTPAHMIQHEHLWVMKTVHDPKNYALWRQRL